MRTKIREEIRFALTLAHDALQQAGVLDLAGHESAQRTRLLGVQQALERLHKTWQSTALRAKEAGTMALTLNQSSMSSEVGNFMIQRREVRSSRSWNTHHQEHNDQGN